MMMRQKEPSKSVYDRKVYIYNMHNSIYINISTSKKRDNIWNQKIGRR